MMGLNLGHDVEFRSAMFGRSLRIVAGTTDFILSVGKSVRVIKHKWGNQWCTEIDPLLVFLLF